MGRHKTIVGAPCHRGHAYSRRCSDGQCRICATERKRKQRQKGRRLVRAHVEFDYGYLGAKRLYRRPPPRASRADLDQLWIQQAGRCGLTGMSLVGVRPHLDHKTPVAIGGTSAIENLHWVHPFANNAKNHYSVEEFRTWLLAAADALRQKIELERLL